MNPYWGKALFSDTYRHLFIGQTNQTIESITRQAATLSIQTVNMVKSTDVVVQCFPPKKERTTNICSQGSEVTVGQLRSEDLGRLREPTATQQRLSNVQNLPQARGNCVLHCSASVRRRRAATGTTRRVLVRWKGGVAELHCHIKPVPPLVSRAEPGKSF